MKRCDRCEHSFQSTADPQGPASRIDVLRCRCQPPQVVSHIFGGMFPVVDPAEYCGQFKQKGQTS